MSSSNLIRLLNDALLYRNSPSSFPLASAEEILSFVGCEIYGYRKENELRKKTVWNGVAGMGGQGVVFKANYLKNNNSIVAVKFAFPNTSTAQQRLVKVKKSGLEKYRDIYMDMSQNVPDTRFLESAKFQQLLHEQFRLCDYVIIPKVYEYRAAPSPYVIMSWEAGEDLLRCVADKNLIEYTLETFIKLASFIHELHKLGYIHRDIKPDNFKLGVRDRIVSYDFGLLKPMDRTDLTSAGVVLGSIPWSSPKTMLGTPSDVIDDIYSLGILLAAMVLQGRTGYESFRLKNIQGGYDVSSLLDFRAFLENKLPRFLQPVFTKATCINATGGYDVVSEMIEDLENAMYRENMTPGFNLRYQYLAERREQEGIKTVESGSIELAQADTVVNMDISEEIQKIQEVEKNHQKPIKYEKEDTWHEIFGENPQGGFDFRRFVDNLRATNKEIYSFDCYRDCKLCRLCREKNLYFCKKIVMGIVAVVQKCAKEKERESNEN